jgi:hypothetical protein
MPRRTDIQPTHTFGMIATPRHPQPAGGTGVVVRNSSSPIGYTPSSFVPTQFQDDVDVAGCALDEQLEQMQRHYAAASRAASRARFEIDLLEKRGDVPSYLIDHAKRQRAAAETRCARLLTAIEALEDRLENEG